MDSPSLPGSPEEQYYSFLSATYIEEAPDLSEEVLDYQEEVEIRSAGSRSVSAQRDLRSEASSESDYFPAPPWPFLPLYTSAPFVPTFPEVRRSSPLVQQSPAPRPAPVSAPPTPVHPRNTSCSLPTPLPTFPSFLRHLEVIKHSPRSSRRPTTSDFPRTPMTPAFPPVRTSRQAPAAPLSSGEEAAPLLTPAPRSTGPPTVPSSSDDRTTSGQSLRSSTRLRSWGQTIFVLVPISWDSEDSDDE